jgi:hypothetical protein
MEICEQVDGFAIFAKSGSGSESRCVVFEKVVAVYRLCGFTNRHLVTSVDQSDRSYGGRFSLRRYMISAVKSLEISDFTQPYCQSKGEFHASSLASISNVPETVLLAYCYSIPDSPTLKHSSPFLIFSRLRLES